MSSPARIQAPSRNQSRRDKPHVSVYLDKRVQKVIKEIALAYDRKPHDLHIERVTHRPNCTAINQAAAKCRLCL